MIGRNLPLRPGTRPRWILFCRAGPSTMRSKVGPNVSQPPARVQDSRHDSGGCPPGRATGERLRVRSLHHRQVTTAAAWASGTGGATGGGGAGADAGGAGGAGGVPSAPRVARPAWPCRFSGRSRPAGRGFVAVCPRRARCCRRGPLTGPSLWRYRGERARGRRPWHADQGSALLAPRPPAVAAVDQRSRRVHRTRRRLCGGAVHRRAVRISPVRRSLGRFAAGDFAVRGGLFAPRRPGGRPSRQRGTATAGWSAGQPSSRRPRWR